MALTGARCIELQRPLSFPNGIDARTISAHTTLLSTDGIFHVITCSGGSYNLIMYAASVENKGRLDWVYNASATALDINLQQADTTAIATIGQNQSVALVSNGSTWSIAQRGGSSLSASADTISEVTPANGVVVDGFPIKDGGFTVIDAASAKFGTPGTDVVLTADGTDVVITGTGVLYTVDSMALAIGTGKDISVTWDGTRLNVTQALANSEIRWGVDGAGIDQMWYGDTASTYLTWDQSADSLILGGTAKIKAQTIVAATGAAIPVTHSGSFPITQNGAETNTLADPTFIGQWISIFVDTDTSGARVITAASRINQAANTTITLTEVGDFIKLEAITIGGALKWQVVANDGAVLT